MFTCYYCKLVFDSPSLLLSHMRKNCLQFTKNRQNRCGERGCIRNFSTNLSFKHHLSREHSSKTTSITLNTPNCASTSDYLQTPHNQNLVHPSSVSYSQTQTSGIENSQNFPSTSGTSELHHPTNSQPF